MKWRIKNPAPLGPRLTKWGDYHFGRSLSKYLERKGEEVVTDYQPEWEHDGEADVVLCIRGKFPYEPQPGPINVMWNISHPAGITPEEYERYDLVFIASMAHTARVKEQVSVPVEAMLQCTDCEECYPPDAETGRRRSGFVFVGNSRDVVRPGVIWALEYGMPLKVWGNMWDKFIDREHIMAKNLPGEERGGLYRQSRVTLNDHWDDMKQFGFVNDRCFDALACGLPLISDYHDELHQLFPDEVLYYRNREELHDCMTRVVLNYPAIKARVDGLRDRIRNEFSFEARAQRFIDAVKAYKQNGQHAAAPLTFERARGDHTGHGDTGPFADSSG